MSLSAFKQPPSDVERDISPAQAGVDTEHNGYLHWLSWVQKMLSASALRLYAHEPDKPDAPLTQLALWHADDAISLPSTQLAMRAVLTRALVQARQKNHPDQSVMCVPDVQGSNDKRVKHVLVVERCTHSKLELHTQARLVMWAFESLSRYAVHNVRSLSVHRAAQNEIPVDKPSNALAPVSNFAQCALRLAHIAEAEHCVLARVPVRGEQAGGAMLLAVSGQARIDPRLSAARTLVQAIDTTYRKKPLPLKSTIDNDAALLSITPADMIGPEQRGARLLLPVLLAQQWFIVLIERGAGQPFTVAEQSELETLARTLLSIVLLTDPATLGVQAAIARDAKRLRKRVMQNVPGYVATAGAGLALLVFVLYPVEHRISAPLSVEAAQRHVLIAPMDGFVHTVSASAGDTVTKGQVLAQLDDQELRLDMQKSTSEALQNQQAYNRVLAAHDRVEAARLKEEGTLIQTELDRLRLQQEKMVLRAPVDGVVLSGSWDDFLGAAVSAGDTLFSLGSQSSPRLVLDVSEYDVSRVRADQPVSIRLAADPSTVLPGIVTAIMPLTIAEAGVNSVQVHASLEHDVALRPGMQGIGKVLVGDKSRLMQWFERVSARAVWLGWKLGILQ